MKNRWAAATALAAALMLGTTACTFSAEIATQKDYDPSDGVSTEFGELSVYNAMLIGEDPDALNLVMTVFNPTDSVRRVEVQWFVDGERVTESIFAEASGLTSVGGPDQPSLLVTGLDTVIGGLVPLYFSTNTGSVSELLVPTLRGDLEEYDEYAPEFVVVPDEE
ncbi:MAG: hypothetical protein RIC81_12560 [Microcella pacifica]|uniref:Uncharacterized protein n=1 Tax=Microcella pacifica TaxID=2591847 RepID=A0A9E5JUA0_9MICO|nr:hypothetical protein [Microcella pacifica]MBR21176.1 hypothetical protein [Leifsonia sp.]NHF62563.1 hypothetical protein [Microcella pacifica]